MTWYERVGMFGMLFWAISLRIQISELTERVRLLEIAEEDREIYGGGK